MSGYDIGASARDKHIFVAGGSSGINLGIAAVFARCGARISLCSRKAERVAAAVDGLKAHAAEAWGTAADVRNYAEVEAALKQAKEKLGPIDVLVSGAAGNFVSPALAMSANAFKTVVDIDLLGTFNVLRAGFEFLRKPGAAIINISAPQAIHPYPYQAHVNAAKAGIDILTKTLAVEWGPAGVRVNAICPGPIADTEGMARLAPTEAARAMVVKGTPLGRFGTKDEIGAAALYLASPFAAYVTGVVLPVDGGSTLLGPGRLGEAMTGAYEAAAPLNR
jgi:NAD(P)-dependent dehydrogenase (short-subunit alcohol dehydrogenase family)